MRASLLALSACAAWVFATFPASASTLDDVKAKGQLKCGVAGDVPGFAAPDDKGQMRGIDADICYALAAAIFGDKTKVKFINLTTKERFTSLTSGDIDVLSRQTTATMSRDASLGLDFTYYNYIDGTGLLGEEGHEGGER